MAQDELDNVNYPNEQSMFLVGKRLVKALESIDRRLADLNETLSSVVGEFADDPSRQKTYTALRTYESKK